MSLEAIERIRFPQTTKIREGRKEAYHRYVETGKVPEDIFKILLDGDRSPTRKYVEWGCREYTRIGERPEHIMDVALQYNQLAERGTIAEKDIYKVSIEAAERAVEEAGDKSTKSEDKRNAKDEGAELVYETDKIRVYLIKTREACQLYGAGTEWCITGKGEYWSQYTQRDFVTFYYVICKHKFTTHPKTGQIIPVKYAVEVGINKTTRAWDCKDRSMSLEKMFEEIGETPFI